MTTADQFTYSLSVFRDNIKAGVVGEALMEMVQSLNAQLRICLEQGDQFWVVETQHRLTTKLQVINAIVQGYELRVIPYGRQESSDLCFVADSRLTIN